MTGLKKYRIICLSLLLSSILFLKINVDFFDYIFVAIAFLVFSFLSYPIFWKNRNLNALFVSVAIPNLFVYLMLKFFREGYVPVGDVMDRFFVGYIIILVLILIYVLKKGKDEEKSLENFFEYRKRELDELERRLRETSIVGIDAMWGDGKSYLMQLFAQKQKRENKKEKMYVINISVLSSTIETIESYIISEISTFLEENMVFSYSSPKIKKFFSQPLLKNWSSFFDEKNSYSELFGSLVSDVKTLGKKIVLSFEDLERIRDAKIILKVFNISEKINCECEKIGCNCIKIIYQYDKKELINVLGIQQKPNYLEKYIPVELRLTPVPFIDAIKVYIKKNKCKNINDEDFSFLEDESMLKISLYNLRKIRLFLSEIDSLLNDGKLKANKKMVIVFFIVKYFYPSLFLQIEFGQPLMNTISLTLNENGKKTELKLTDFRQRREIDVHHLDEKMRELDIEKSRELSEKRLTQNEISEIEHRYHIQETALHRSFEDGPLGWKNLETNNFELFSFLRNLGYDVEDSILNHLSVEQKEKNDSIDEIAWKLKYMGAIGYTKGWGLINEVEKIIDSHEDIELKKRKYTNLLSKTKMLENFQEEDFSEEKIFFTLVKVYVKDVKKWKKIIGFYVQSRSIKFIADDIFPIFNLFKISTKEILLIALKKFVSMDVNVRFCSISLYLSFLNDYLKQIKLFGFFSKQRLYEDCFYEYAYKENFSKFEKLKLALSNIKNEVKDIRSQNIKVQSIVDECDVIIKFIDKNIELISAPMMREKRKNQEDDVKKENEYKDYLVLNSEEELNVRIEEKYQKNEVSLKEITKIRELFEKKFTSKKGNKKVKKTPQRATATSRKSS